MARRFYDDEFSPAVLQMLKKLEVLRQSNPVHFIPLIYNVAGEVDAIVQRFDTERKDNPLLETTPPEAWLTGEIIPAISVIRSNVEIKEPVLGASLSRHFRRAVPPHPNEAPSEQQLLTTIRPYQITLKKLLLDLYDRRKSLRGILGIPVAACTIREVMTDRKPNSRREATILGGINDRRTNQYIARALDKLGLSPRTHKSYSEMLHVSPQNFYALKSGVKRKYRKT